jgi:threonine dehydratase
MYSRALYKRVYDVIRSSSIISKTPLEYNSRLSNKYSANIFFKREDLQEVRSFKIRGAYYKIMNNRPNNVTTASAGNHAQGVALTCRDLKINHSIFVPVTTPKQKIDRIRHFGQDYIDLQIVGSNFNESLDASREFAKTSGSLFVHPFDDEEVILGQSTVVQEICEDIRPDVILCGVGGGGLISGVGSYIKDHSIDCSIIGVEPENADSMKLSLEKGEITPVSELDVFVDGAAVKTVGEQTFKIGKEVIDQMYSISNNQLCHHIIDIYQNDGIIVEPAGALSVAVLDNVQDTIKGKNVICMLSGGNNDITRYGEMLEKAYRYRQLKHYFLLEFSQTPGQLAHFINKVLQGSIDITRFEYLKKTNKEVGTVLIGLELEYPQQLEQLILNMEKHKLSYRKIEEDDVLYSYLV